MEPTDSSRRAAPAPSEVGRVAAGEDVLDPHYVFRVGSRTNAKACSVAVVSRINRGMTASIQAIGSDAVNNALKACIHASSRLFNEAGIATAFSAAILRDIGPDAVGMTMERVAKPLPDGLSRDVLRVAKNSSAGGVAGAVAGKIRQGASLVSLSCIGAPAALRLVKAIAIAEEYLNARDVTPGPDAEASNGSGSAGGTPGGAGVPASAQASSDASLSPSSSPTQPRIRLLASAHFTALQDGERTSVDVNVVPLSPSTSSTST